MDRLVFKGDLCAIIERTQEYTIQMGQQTITKVVKHELASRPPGIRAIIRDNNRILINREFRYELNGWDYRLPGGKMFDTYSDYLDSLSHHTFKKCAEEKLRDELHEEADLDIISFRFLKSYPCGFSCDWDLYYYLVDAFKLLPSFESQNIQKNEYEFIEHMWFEPANLFRMCMDGSISEGRSALAIIQFLVSNDYLKFCVG